MLITRQEKERLVIKLAEEGRTTREIAKEVHISLKDIGKIIRKATGDLREDRKREGKTAKNTLTICSGLSDVQRQELPCRCSD